MMSDGNDDDFRGAHSIKDVERESWKHEPPRSVLGNWIPDRRLGDPRNGCIYLVCKGGGAQWAAFFISRVPS